VRGRAVLLRVCVVLQRSRAASSTTQMMPPDTASSIE
jgi:hypothetical protein